MPLGHETIKLKIKEENKQQDHINFNQKQLYDKQVRINFRPLIVSILRSSETEKTELTNHETTGQRKQ